MALTLKRLLEMLHEEGVSDEDAEDVIESVIKQRKEQDENRSRALARVQGQKIEPTHTPMLGPSQRPVDYGDETAAEAKERWIRQEMEDPQGVFAGGQSAGGIFGSGPIATDTYDPAAMRRSVDMRASAQSAQVQQRTLTVLERVLERLESASGERSGRLPSQPDPRRLGKRKK